MRITTEIEVDALYIYSYIYVYICTQAALKGIRGEERGGGKKVKTSGARDSVIEIDLTAASDDDETLVSFVHM